MKEDNRTFCYVRTIRLSCIFLFSLNLSGNIYSQQFEIDAQSFIIRFNNTFKNKRVSLWINDIKVIEKGKVEIPFTGGHSNLGCYVRKGDRIVTILPFDNYNSVTDTILIPKDSFYPDCGFKGQCIELVVGFGFKRKKAKTIALPGRALIVQRSWSKFGYSGIDCHWVAFPIIYD